MVSWFLDGDWQPIIKYSVHYCLPRIQFTRPYTNDSSFCSLIYFSLIVPIQLIDISSSHSTLLFFLAWQKNVFPPLLPIVPTPCGTFYKGPTRPLLSIGKSIIKDSVNMNVARIHILFKNLWSWSFVFEVGTQNRNYPQRDRSSQTILLTFVNVLLNSKFLVREKNKSIKPILAKNGTLWKKEGKLPDVQTQVGEKREKRREG